MDLFAGAGGLSLGFEQAGFDVVAAVEYDPVHAATHHYNFPLTPVLCRDIRRIDRSDLVSAVSRGWSAHNPDSPSWNGHIDLVIGGPSCQGFSTIGKRHEQDERNELLGEFARVVRLLRPAAFCLENVPGLLEDRFSDVRNSLLSRLRNAGYKVRPFQILDAVNFGVPQKRRRAVLVGFRDQVSYSGISSNGEPARSVRHALEGLPDPTAYEELWSSDEVVVDQSHDTLAELGPYARYAYGLDALGVDLSRPRKSSSGLLTGSRLTKHSAVSIDRFGATAQGQVEPVSHYYRLNLDAPSRTLRAGTGSERGAFSAPRPIHPTAARVITVREAARLHSFPDWFRFHTTNWHGHRQIGNSVPPLLGRSIGSLLLSALGLDSVKVEEEVPVSDVGLLRLTPSGAATEMAASLAEVPAKRMRRS